ncbi:STAS domain-containing protein [Streptomyces sp. YJ-C3]
MDHHTTPEVRAALPGIDLCPVRQLVLDLEGLAPCDSSGVGVLIACPAHKGAWLPGSGVGAADRGRAALWLRGRRWNERG